MSAVDDDPFVEPEFDAFSLVLPLPYRVAIIIVLGTWAWGVNLQYLSLLKIDVPSLVQYPRLSPSPKPTYHTTYQFASLLSIPLGISLLLFWILTHASQNLVLKYELFPNFYLACLLIAFIAPFRIAHNGRLRFLKTLRRIALGGLAEPNDGKFGDILLADVLTSYAKVVGDLFVALCMAVNGRHSTAQPDRSCGGWFVVPFLISVPSLIRLRQCLIEYMRVRKGIRTGAAVGTGWGGQHLANALKYSSAFPVVVLSTLQRYDAASVGMTETGLSRAWLLAVFINSLYSFYWDVMKDWDLTLLSSQRHSPDHPYGLRRHRYVHSPALYYLVIFIDLLLRFTWSFKLSPHLHHGYDMEGGVFVLEMLEVFRRWVWIFLRVETEWMRTNGGNKGPATDDVLLGDYTGKYDDD